MVLNNSNSYSTTATSDEDDAWEMVGEESNNEITTPLVDTTRENNRSNHAPAAAEGMEVTAAVEVPNINETAAPGGSVLERTTERQSSHHIGTIDLAGTSNNQNINESTTNQGVDANASIASGMSSITGDHHTVSDVDEDAAEGGEGEEEEEVVMKDGAANTDDLLLEEDKVEDEQAAPSAGTTHTPRAPEETIEFEEATTETSSDPLVESLSQMGFEKEQIEKAIGDLRESGQEVDADSVIGSMAGETPPEAGEDGDNRPRNPFHTTWDFVESTAQNIDDQHQLRRRTRDLGENIGRSARDLWSNVREESVRFKSNVRETCDQADVHARTATTQLRHSASNVGETIRRANEEHRIAEKVATVAVVGGATLLAIGNPRAGVATLAVAGASLAAGEALRNSSSSRDRPWRRQQSGEDSPYSPSYNGDHGLSEGLHLD